MKKDILFVIPSLDAGGAEKSLISLLSVIDYSLYNVDLILLNKKGLFLNLLPNQVNILDIEGDYKLFTSDSKTFFIKAFRKFKLKLIVNRISYTLKNNLIKNKAVAEQKSWKNLRTAIPTIKKKYEAAIGYLEKSSLYFVVDCIEADKKMGFIHNDYQKLGLKSSIDKPFFDKMTYLITVSDKCVSSLKKVFPSIQNKVKLMHNIVSEKLINKLANEFIPAEFKCQNFNILSIGRLHPQKGFDYAIEACYLIKKKGHNVKWFIIGEGDERELLESKIKEYQLQDNMFLIGLKENPYPYIKYANLYAQPSRYEGKSIAIDEAKILKKPILVTNFSTVSDQIINGTNGLICEMSPESIAKALSELLTNEKILNHYTSNLINEHLSNENEIYKLYNFINE